MVAAAIAVLLTGAATAVVARRDDGEPTAVPSSSPTPTRTSTSTFGALRLLDRETGAFVLVFDDSHELVRLDIDGRDATPVDPYGPRGDNLDGALPSLSPDGRRLLMPTTAGFAVTELSPTLSPGAQRYLPDVVEERGVFRMLPTSDGFWALMTPLAGVQEPGADGESPTTEFRRLDLAGRPVGPRRSLEGPVLGATDRGLLVEQTDASGETAVFMLVDVAGGRRQLGRGRPLLALRGDALISFDNLTCAPDAGSIGIVSACPLHLVDLSTRRTAALSGTAFHDTSRGALGVALSRDGRYLFASRLQDAAGSTLFVPEVIELTTGRHLPLEELATAADESEQRIAGATWSGRWLVMVRGSGEVLVWSPADGLFTVPRLVASGPSWMGG